MGAFGKKIAGAWAWPLVAAILIGASTQAEAGAIQGASPPGVSGGSSSQPKGEVDGGTGGGQVDGGTGGGGASGGIQGGGGTSSAGGTTSNVNENPSNDGTTPGGSNNGFTPQINSASYPPLPEVSLPRSLFLTLSIIMLMFSIHQFFEAQQFQSWVQRGTKNRLDPWTGSVPTLTGCGVATTIWMVAWWWKRQDDLAENDILLGLLFWPEEFAGLFFVLAFGVGLMAFAKYVVAIPLASAAANRTRATRLAQGSPKAGKVGAILLGVSVVADILGIWGAFHLGAL